MIKIKHNLKMDLNSQEIMKFKDVSAWYHIVTVFDTTNGTAGDRI